MILQINLFLLCISQFAAKALINSLKVVPLLTHTQIKSFSCLNLTLQIKSFEL